MNYLSDTLTVGLVLILLFGSIALFLYTRVQQAEQKMSLLESILLNLKIASEVKAYQDLPEDDIVAEPVSNACTIEIRSPVESNTDHYTPFEEEAEEKPVDPMAFEKEDTADISSAKPESYTPFEETSPVTEPHAYESMAVKELQSLSKLASYEAMTIKELHTLAKMRGVNVNSSLKKAAIIDVLKAADQDSSGVLSSAPLMENHSLVSDEL